MGEFLLGGKGNRQHEMMMMGDDDEIINFLHSLHKGILRARGKHILLFALLLLLELCFAPCILY